MDKVKLVELLKNHSEIARSPYVIKFEDEITDKIKENMIDIFGNVFENDPIIAFIDTSIFGTGDDGYIFTANKICFTSVLSKPQKFWYEDIENVIVIEKGKKKKICTLFIELYKEDTIEVNTLVQAKPFRDFLLELILPTCSFSLTTNFLA